MGVLVGKGVGGSCGSSGGATMGTVSAGPPGAVSWVVIQPCWPLMQQICHQVIGIIAAGDRKGLVFDGLADYGIGYARAAAQIDLRRSNHDVRRWHRRWRIGGGGGGAKVGVGVGVTISVGVGVSVGKEIPAITVSVAI